MSKNLPSSVSQSLPIDHILSNNIKKEKFENNDNLTFISDKNSMLSFENTPYIVTENSRVNPYTTPDRSPISMYYDFDNDNDSDERVDQRKEPLTVKKKQFVRKPTGIEKDRNRRHDAKFRKRFPKKSLLKQDKKPLKSKERKKRKKGSDLDDDEMDLETRRQIEMNSNNNDNEQESNKLNSLKDNVNRNNNNIDEYNNKVLSNLNNILLNKLKASQKPVKRLQAKTNSLQNESDNEPEISKDGQEEKKELNSINVNNVQKNNNKKKIQSDNLKHNLLSGLNNILIQKFKKKNNQKTIKRLRSKHFLTDQERQKKKKLKDKKSNKRKKYGDEKVEYPNKKFKENLSDETDEDSSSTIVPLNNIIIVIFSFYIYFVNFR